MRHRKQNLQLAAAAAAAVIFIAVLVILAVVLSGGKVTPIKTGGGGPIVGPVGVIHNSVIPANGQYKGYGLGFSFPAGANSLQSQAASADAVTADFKVGSTRVQVEDEVAPPGLSLSLLASTYGPGMKEVVLASGPVFVEESHTGSSSSVLLIRYSNDHFVTLQAAGKGDVAALIMKLNSSLGVQLPGAVTGAS